VIGLGFAVGLGGDVGGGHELASVGLLRLEGLGDSSQQVLLVGRPRGLADGLGESRLQLGQAKPGELVHLVLDVAVQVVLRAPGK